MHRSKQSYLGCARLTQTWMLGRFCFLKIPGLALIAFSLTWYVDLGLPKALGQPAIPQPAIPQPPIQRVPNGEQDPDEEGFERVEMDLLGGGQGVFPAMNRKAFREMLFGALGGSENAFQTMRRESIRRELDRIEQVCELSEEQKIKLEEAIEIDIQHIHVKIETLISDFEPRMAIERFQEIQQNVYAYADQINSGQGSSHEIWRKVLRSMLTEEQTEKLDQDKLKVQANENRTRQLQILLQLQRKLGLTEKQRTSILAWLRSQQDLEDPFWKWCERLLLADSVGELNERQRKVLAEVPKQALAEQVNQ